MKVVDILKDHTFDPTDCQVSKCGTKNCKTCNILITENSLSSNFTKRSFSTHSFENLSCRSYNLVYAIECTLCGLIYVGETKGKLRSRMNGHRFQINHGGNQLLYKHFNLPDHSIRSMKVRILEKIYHPTNNPNLRTPFRRKREEYRISGIFRAGKFWRKWRLEGVLNFHWVLFSLFQRLSMKTYSRVFYSLCLFLASFRRSRTQRKLNPREKFPIYGIGFDNWELLLLMVAMTTLIA